MVSDISCTRCRGTGKEPNQDSGLDPIDNVMNTACKSCGGTGRGQSSAIGDMDA